MNINLHIAFVGTATHLINDTNDILVKTDRIESPKTINLVRRVLVPQTNNSSSKLFKLIHFRFFF